jgi:hypothetical protein
MAQTEAVEEKPDFAVISFDEEEDAGEEKPIVVNGEVQRPSIEDPRYRAQEVAEKPEHMKTGIPLTQPSNVAQTKGP